MAWIPVKGSTSQPYTFVTWTIGNLATDYLPRNRVKAHDLISFGECHHLIHDTQEIFYDILVTKEMLDSF